MKKLSALRPDAFFEVGEEVAWTSQAQGYTKTKVGTIVAIVDSEMWPQDVVNQFEPALRKLSTRKMGGGSPRDHVSYLIRVKRSLYWPRVEGLRLVRAATVAEFQK